MPNDENTNTPEPVAATPDLSDAEMKMPEQTFGEEPATEEKSSVVGAVLVALIVILLLILGGLYLWGTTLKNDSATELPMPTERPTAEENNEPESTNAEAEVEVFEAVSPSDEIAAIEADLESTDLDSLDAELDAIEAELDASFEAE